MRNLRPKKRIATLQLTSLLDMFTIILVFLLQSFQGEEGDVDLHAGLALPTSDSRQRLESAADVAVAPEGLFVEGARVAALEDPDTWPALVRAVADARGEVDDTTLATVQADKTLSYAQVEPVLRRIAEGGCHQLRLVISKE